MKTLRKLAISIAVLFTALATSANASVLTLSASPTEALPGETFFVSIFGDFDDVGGFKGGDVRLNWDDLTTLHVATDLEFDGDLFAGFSCPGSVNCVSDPGVEQVSWGTFFLPTPLIPAGAGNTLLATLEFTQGSAGNTNFFMLDGTAGWADASGGAAPTPDLSATLNVSAIPVPAAVWLFGSGLLGLIGVARRKAA